MLGWADRYDTPAHHLPLSDRQEGGLREFIGFNRAKNAIIEAAILATRVRLLGVAPILQEYRRLSEIVQKTGGEQETLAMAYLQEYVERQRR
ncbi:MAG: DUF447 family protein [Candidatus Methylomirabilis sp.]|nr:DUF447 family protein [Candidatus Methylomirabilis sp.]